MTIDYKQKYLKYKNKYVHYKRKMYYGGMESPHNTTITGDLNAAPASPLAPPPSSTTADVRKHTQYHI